MQSVNKLESFVYQYRLFVTLHLSPPSLPQHANSLKIHINFKHVIVCM